MKESKVVFLTRSSNKNNDYSSARSGEFTRHTTSISIEFTECKIRYTEVEGEITSIEILDNGFNVNPNKPAQWVCAGELFNVFIGFCEDHLANLGVH